MGAAIHERSAAALAHAIRAGELSCRAVVEAFLARIAEVNPRIRAVVAEAPADALATADALDRELAEHGPRGPLHGVPMTVKDLHDVAGLPATHGLPFASRRPLSRDSTCAARLRAAGVVFVGKTNVPLAGYDWQTRSRLRGVTVNPFDAARTPGGSSGGAAAALASGMTPLELGSDLAGSIRIPAHFCGVMGLKPTEGRVPLDGHGPPASRGVLRSMLTIGPMARSIEDLRIAFAVLTARSPDAMTPAIGPAQPLRVAWTDTLCGVTADSATRSALGAFVTALTARGAHVERACPTGLHDAASALELWGAVNGFEFAQCWPPPFRWGALRWLFRTGIVRLAIGPGTLTDALSRSMAWSPRTWLRSLDRRAAFADEVERFVRGYDLFVCPAAATPAFEHRRRPTPIRVDDRQVPYAAAMAAFACPFAVSGHPSLVVPIGTTPAGLPIGAQLVARRGADEWLLSEPVAALVSNG